MKKTIAVSAAALIAVCTAAGAMAATTASPEPTKSPDAKARVTVSSDKSTGVSFENTTYDQESKSVKSVLGVTNSLNAISSNLKQSFNVKSVSDGEQPVDVYLRLSTQSSSTTAEYDAKKLISTYEITVKDGNSVIYETNTDDMTITSPEKGEYVLDILLGRFNESDDEESGDYSVEVTIPSGTTANQIKNAKSSVDWEIVSDPVEEGATAIPMSVSVTAEPTAAVTATPNATVLVTPVPTQNVTSTPVVSSTPAATVDNVVTPTPAASSEIADNSTSKMKYVGDGDNEIKPGTYKITAKNTNAEVKIYDKDGNLAKEIAINEKKPSQVVTLTAGQSISNDGGIVLDPYVSPTAAPKTTVKPSATTSPAKTTSTKAAATTAPKTASSSKTNPKTGDTAPVAGAAALAIFALGMAAYPSLEKKRENK